ncbi:MAG: hypothetical protein AB7T31_05690 [Gemmatimonadales bacterium]
MNTKHLIFAATALSLACSGGPAVEINETPEVPAERWQGPITSPPNLAGAVQMEGTAWMATAEESNQTRVHIEIANAAPGGRHPWEIQRGRCGSSGDLFGSPADYEPIEVNDDGQATMTTEIPMSLPRDGEYSVEVLASPANRDLVVACANLAPPIQRGDFN